MADVFFDINNIFIPQVIVAEKDFIVVYKPPGMHSAPLAKSNAKTIYSWSCTKFPEIANLTGRKAGEGGLLHRLDHETQGLMLLARTETGMESLLAQQKEGKIYKEYSALASKTKKALPGFMPEKPPVGNKITSAFRPYGVGGKSVRPVLDGDKQYTTEIIEYDALPENIFSLRLGIVNGFRHQIRCHLAWLGKPILNDKLYGGLPCGNGLLALRACSLKFNDPASGRELGVSICGEWDLLEN